MVSYLQNLAEILLFCKVSIAPGPHDARGKYNQLLRIEQLPGKNAVCVGASAMLEG